MSLKVEIVTPAPPGSTSGNRITAQRYARILRDLGAGARVVQTWSGSPCDLLIALHAGRSAPSVKRFAATYPNTPVVVVVTGTDIYGIDGRESRVEATLAAATRIVVLQPEALAELAPPARAKSTVILQSAERASGEARPLEGVFEVVALSHLRGVKDPFLAAEAARRLPADSRLRVSHVGGVLDRGLELRAREESARNAHWRWLGERSHKAALHVLQRAQGFVQTSLSEGGSSALAEAILAEKPVLSTRIPGSVGMLGADHPGLYEPGDANGLATLLARLERDADWRAALVERSRALAPQFTLEVEREAWRALLAELGLANGRPRSRLIRVGRETPLDEFCERARAALAASPRRLPSRFEAGASGADVFDPWSEPEDDERARVERSLLARCGDELVRAVPPGSGIVELGASVPVLTSLVIAAAIAREGRTRFTLVDVSREHLERSAATLCDKFASLDVRAVEAAPFTPSRVLTPEGGGIRLWLWLGARIANFPRDEASGLLSGLRERMDVQDRLLVTVPRRELGVACAGRFGALLAECAARRRLAEHGAPTGLEGLHASATHVADEGRIAILLEARADVQLELALPGLTVSLARGEQLQIGSAWTWSEAELDALEPNAGLRRIARHTDERGWHDLVLLAPVP